MNHHHKQQHKPKPRLSTSLPQPPHYINDDNNNDIKYDDEKKIDITKHISTHPCDAFYYSKVTVILSQRYSTKSKHISLSDRPRFSQSITDTENNTSKNREEVADYYNEANWYQKLWGEGNIHFGYFGPNVDEIVDGVKEENVNKVIEFVRDIETTKNKSSEELANYIQYCKLSTLRLASFAGINRNSIVLDLGCGYGLSGKKLLSYKHCKKVIGIDLSKKHIDEATEEYKNEPRLEFICGSFTNLTDIDEIIKYKHEYTHIWSEASLSHCPQSLDKIIKDSKSLLNAKSGKLVINDLIANKPANDDTKKYVYDRMKYEYDSLLSSGDYIDILEKNGFKILYFEELSKHLWLSYKLLVYHAQNSGEEYIDLIEKYNGTCDAIERDEFGMINIVAQITEKDVEDESSGYIPYIQQTLISIGTMVKIKWNG